MPINLNELIPGMRAKAEDLNENFITIKNVLDENAVDINTLKTSKQNVLNTSIKGQMYVSASTNAIDIIAPNTSETTRKYLSQLNSTSSWEEIETKQPAFVPYSVASGAVDTNGLPNYITKVDNTTIKINASSTPLVVCYPNGSTETITEDVTISGLTADGIYNIWVEKGSSDISTRIKAAINNRTETYTPISTGNITTTAFAISGGDGTGYSKSNAFDNNENTWWGSYQIGSNIAGQAYIGQNFGSTQTIKVLELIQNNSPESSVTSVKVQYSANGTTWTDAQTFNGLGSGYNLLNLTTAITAQYVRVLANSSIPNETWGWAVSELKMYSASSGNDGDLNLQICVKPFIPRKKTSGIWTITQFTPFGEVTKTSGTIGTPICYAFNGKFISQDLALTTTFATPIVFNHNIGTNLIKASGLRLRCLTAEQNYIAGDVAVPWWAARKSTTTVGTYQYDNNYNPLKLNGTTVTYGCWSDVSSGYDITRYIITNPQTLANFTPTSNYWMQFCVVERGF